MTARALYVRVRCRTGKQHLWAKPLGQLETFHPDAARVPCCKTNLLASKFFYDSPAQGGIKPSKGDVAANLIWSGHVTEKRRLADWLAAALKQHEAGAG
jgi:hypothetical protein